MNTQKQNIAIAEALGWTFVDRVSAQPHGLPPAGRHNRYTEKIPDYVNDLNVMAQARDVLIATPELRIKWTNKLRDVVGLTATRRNKSGQPIVSDIDLLFATPQQLAQALLQTLNLWEDV